MKRFMSPSALVSIPLLCAVTMLGCLRVPGHTAVSSEKVRPYSLEVVSNQRLTETPDVAEYVTAWSPNGKKLTYTAFRGIMGKGGIYVGVLPLKGDGAGEAWSVLPESRFKEFGGNWSPDGKRVVFISDRSGNYDIWTASERGADLRQLTTDDADDVYPTWSPDGRKIAFLSTRSREIAIWTMNTDGSDQRQATAGGNGDWGTDWSPDGTRIVFGSSRLSAENKPASEYDAPLKNFFETVFIGGVASEHIWSVDLPTQLIARMTPAHDGRALKYWHPTWSPDGTKIAYVSNEAGSADVWVMDADGRNPVQLTTDPSYDIFPAWSPDGTQIAFSSAPHEKVGSDIWMLTLQQVDR